MYKSDKYSFSVVDLPCWLRALMLGQYPGVVISNPRANHIIS